jgi:hypothetical protein
LAVELPDPAPDPGAVCASELRATFFGCDSSGIDINNNNNKKKKKKAEKFEVTNRYEATLQTPSMYAHKPHRWTLLSISKKKAQKGGLQTPPHQKKTKIQTEKKINPRGEIFFFFFFFFVFLTVFHMASRAIRASALSRPPSLGAVPEEDGSSSDDGSGADSLSAGSSRSNDDSNGDSGSDDDTTTKFGPATLAKQDSAIPHAF